MPNYEVHYKPWVRQLVSDLSESPAILGWQLGNELKARNNVRNGIEDGYDWYLDFVKDMTDTIRSVDKNHLIFVGAQYFAELTDIPYRPGPAASSRTCGRSIQGRQADGDGVRRSTAGTSGR